MGLFLFSLSSLVSQDVELEGWEKKRREKKFGH